MGKKILVVLAGLFLWMASANAQKEYFVYLQTEDLTPFYVMMKGKTISSTTAGYLVLGKLVDSTYPIKLGLLGSTEVQDYGLKVAGKNAGYLVKKTDDRGWVIADLQTNATQMSMEWSSALAANQAREKLLEADKKRVADSTATANAMAIEKAQADSIKALEVAAAALVAKDTVAAVVQATPTPAPGAKVDTAAAIIVPVVSEQQRKADSISAVIAAKEKELKDLQAALATTTATTVVAAGNNKTETTASNKSETTTNERDEKKVAGAAAVGAAVVTAAVIGDGKTEKEVKPDSATMNAAAAIPVATNQKTAADSKKSTAPVFLDIDFTADADSAAKKAAAQPAMLKDSVAKEVMTTDSVQQKVVPAPVAMAAAVVDSAAVASPSTAVDSVKVILAVVPAVKDTVVVVADSVKVSETPKLIRQPCTGMLSRDEVESLIEKTGKLTDLDDITAAYKKAFKESCVSTTNLKKIANALASDVARYNVFEAAYAYTLDYFSFSDLSSLLKDPYYLNKFKTLLQQ